MRDIALALCAIFVVAFTGGCLDERTPQREGDPTDAVADTAVAPAADAGTDPDVLRDDPDFVYDAGDESDVEVEGEPDVAPEPDLVEGCDQPVIPAEALELMDTVEPAMSLYDTGPCGQLWTPVGDRGRFGVSDVTPGSTHLSNNEFVEGVAGEMGVMNDPMRASINTDVFSSVDTIPDRVSVKDVVYNGMGHLYVVHASGGEGSVISGIHVLFEHEDEWTDAFVGVDVQPWHPLRLSAGAFGEAFLVAREWHEDTGGFVSLFRITVEESEHTGLMHPRVERLYQIPEDDPRLMPEGHDNVREAFVTDLRVGWLDGDMPGPVVLVVQRYTDGDAVLPLAGMVLLGGDNLERLHVLDRSTWAGNLGSEQVHMVTLSNGRELMAVRNRYQCSCEESDNPNCQQRELGDAEECLGEARSEIVSRPLLQLDAEWSFVDTGWPADALWDVNDGLVVLRAAYSGELYHGTLDIIRSDAPNSDPIVLAREGWIDALNGNGGGIVEWHGSLMRTNDGWCALATGNYLYTYPVGEEEWWGFVHSRGKLYASCHRSR